MGNEQPFRSLPVRSGVRRSASLEGTVCASVMPIRGAGHFQGSACRSPSLVSELSAKPRRFLVSNDAVGVGEHTRPRVFRPAPSPVGGRLKSVTRRLVRRTVSCAPRGRGTQHARARALPVSITWFRLLARRRQGARRPVDGFETEIRSSIGERTRPACQFGRRARTFATQYSQNFPGEEVCAMMFSARRRKPHAGGVCSPVRASISGADVGFRVQGTALRDDHSAPKTFIRQLSTFNPSVLRINNAEGGQPFIIYENKN
jgi:hypothetical protein